MDQNHQNRYDEPYRPDSAANRTLDASAPVKYDQMPPKRDRQATHLADEPALNGREGVPDKPAPNRREGMPDKPAPNRREGVPDKPAPNRREGMPDKPAPNRKAGAPRQPVPPNQPQPYRPAGAPRQPAPPNQPQPHRPAGAPRQPVPPNQPQPYRPAGAPRQHVPPNRPQPYRPVTVTGQHSSSKLVPVIVASAVAVVCAAIAIILLLMANNNQNQSQETEQPPVTFGARVAYETSNVPAATRFVSASASSVLPDQQGHNYSASNLLKNDGTCWCENASGYGEGEWIKLSLPGKQRVSGLRIINGYAGTEKQYDYNCKIAGLTISFSDGSSTTVSLNVFNTADRKTVQTISFDTPVDTDYVQLTIKSVVKGNCPDTCLTYVEPY